MTEWLGSVCLVLASSTGGVGQHVRSLVRGLAAAGVTVTVCGPEATENQFHFSEIGAAAAPDPVTDAPGTWVGRRGQHGAVRFLPVEIPPNPALRDSRAVGALRQILDDPDIDVVHAHGLRAGLVAALARPRQPLVVTWHNAVLTGGLRGHASRLAERVVARTASVTLGASADLVERAAALGAHDARLAPVAAPALAEPRRGTAAVRAELGLDRDQPLILSVGRLHPQKRYDVLVEAARHWRELDPAPAVVIAGSGPSYLPLEALISSTRAPVTLLGHRSDVPDLLATAAIAVVTSDWEARQLFAQEALRAGVPLVATAVGGLPDLVGDAAALVPAGDVEAVDAAVRELLADPVLRDEYRRRGLARAEGWPAEEATLAQVMSVYAELAPAGVPGPDPGPSDARGAAAEPPGEPRR